MAAYHRARTLAEALSIRAELDVVPIAGATDVYPAKVARAAWGDMRHKAVLDLSAIEDLRGIAATREGWRIGALTTWSDFGAAPLPPKFDGLKCAAREIGGVQIQNRGTLAGNICTASPAGDGAPNLLALDASVELVSLQGTRLVPMRDFITGYRTTTCRSDELVAAIRVPNGDDEARSGFLKLGARKYLVISIAMAGGVVTCDASGRVTSARIAVGACSAVPQRLEQLEADVAGMTLEQAATCVNASHVAHLAPIDDVRGSARYRKEAAAVLARDLLAMLAAAQPRRAA